MKKITIKISIHYSYAIFSFQKCSFIQCIKPNSHQSSGLFDEDVVKSQLISSGSVAYQQLMKIGFPSHMTIEELINMFKLNSDFMDYTTKSPKEFCNMLLRSCGLLWKEFKLGNTQIFFRKGKLELFSERLKDGPKTIKQRLDKQKRLRNKFKIAIFKVIMNVQHKKMLVKQNDLRNEKKSNEKKSAFKTGPRKKMKLSPTPNQPTQSMSTEGNTKYYYIETKRLSNSMLILILILNL